jgi:hypothetical protein
VIGSLTSSTTDARWPRAAGRARKAAIETVRSVPAAGRKKLRALTIAWPLPIRLAAGHWNL